MSTADVASTATAPADGRKAPLHMDDTDMSWGGDGGGADIGVAARKSEDFPDGGASSLETCFPAHLFESFAANQCFPLGLTSVGAQPAERGRVLWGLPWTS